MKAGKAPKFRTVALGIFSIYFLLTFCRIVFQGLLERPSFQADHLAAGAGDYGLLLQLAIGVVGLFTAILLLFFQRTIRAWLGIVTVMLGIAASFLFTARGMQRFPRNFSEENFASLSGRVENGVSVRADEVLAALGEPFDKSKHEDGSEAWLYSYMPSCGFGWDRKFVILNDDGLVSDAYTSIEP